MPKVGMEPIRRSALVNATIAEIAAAQSLDVTVGQIARRAGMSTALAHHYFGGKDQIFLAAMRHMLANYKAIILRALAKVPDQRARAAAIINASFDDRFFSDDTVNAWMTLYAASRTNPETRRLLRVYQCRLRSNLTHALRGHSRHPRADADTLAALIDGHYLRAALTGSGSPAAARASTLSTLDLLLQAPE